MYCSKCTGVALKGIQSPILVFHISSTTSVEFGDVFMAVRFLEDSPAMSRRKR